MIISCDFQVHCISLLPPAVVNRILLLKMVAFPFKNTTYTFWKLQEVACARQSAALELGSSSLETAFMYSKTLLILPIFNENHNQYMAASCKYAWNQTGEIWITAPSEILLKKWLSKRGEMGGRKGGETGGRELEGRSGQTKFWKLFKLAEVEDYTLLKPIPLSFLM